MNEAIRQDISDIFGIDIKNHKRDIEYNVFETNQEDGYIRQKIEFDSDGDKVPAYLLTPERMDNSPVILINHQHNSERHFGENDVQDLLACIAPRRLLIVSADDDKYSRDASDVVDEARKTYAQMNAENRITHERYQGGHALTQERYDYIVDWIITNA